MPRRQREQIPGATYHVTARGVLGQLLFRGDDDCARFLALVGDVVERHDWSCHGFCVMGTHYHLLVRTPEADLAQGMQRLNACYSQAFNRRYGQAGHVLERRYHAALVSDESHLLEACRYVALNPVRAGLCDRPSEWLWSSYPALLGVVPQPEFLAGDWVLGLFGHNHERARDRLRAFVEGVDAPADVRVL